MITLQQLKYFRELARTEQLTKTAEKLYITQTSLSNTIIHLEKQLGVRLFDRSGRSIRLNEAGKGYYRFVSEALAALENGQTFLDDLYRQGEQKVSVAMTSSNLWADLIRDFHTRYRSYNIRQIDAERAAFRRLLLEQEVDFILAGVEDLELHGLEYRLLRQEELYLCVPAEHPLAKRQSVRFSDLQGLDFINLPESFGFREFCDHLLKQAGVVYRTSIECDYTMRGKLVEAGFGVAITTGTARNQNALGSSICYVPIGEAAARRPIALVWNPAHYFGRAAADFREYVFASLGA